QHDDTAMTPLTAENQRARTGRLFAGNSSPEMAVSQAESEPEAEESARMRMARSGGPDCRGGAAADLRGMAALPRAGAGVFIRSQRIDPRGGRREQQQVHAFGRAVAR